MKRKTNFVRVDYFITPAQKRWVVKTAKKEKKTQSAFIRKAVDYQIANEE